VTGNPGVTVIMGVYNGEEFLEESVESILRQSYPNFEFIIVDDGSTDKTDALLRQYADQRVRIISQERQGLTKTLIKAAKEARGTFIARQDADDVSAPDRLEKQVSCLECDAGNGLVGTWASIIDYDGTKIGECHYETDALNMHKQLMLCNQFVHGSLMFRASAYENIGGYREEFKYAQDYDLALRIAEKWKLENLDEELYGHRLRKNMVSLANNLEQSRYRDLARQLAVARKFGGLDDIENGESVSCLLRKIPGETSSRSYLHSYDARYTHLCLRSGQLRKARTTLADQLRQNPFNAKLYLQFGLTYLGPARAGRAIEFLDWLRKKRV